MRTTQKHLLLTCSLALMTFFSGPGALAQQVDYSINYNDPYDITKLKGILLLNLDNIVIPSAGLMARYEMGKIFTFDAQYKRSFYYLIPIDQTKSLTNNVRKATNTFEVLGTFHILDRLVDKTLKISLKTTSYGSHTETESMRIPVKSRKIFGARGGLYFYRAPVSASSTASTPVVFKSKQDTVQYRDNALTMGTATGSFLGLSSRRIDKAGVHVDGYGNRRRNRQREFYADVMIGGTKLDDLHLINGKTVSVTTATRPIGWRVGGQWMDNGTFVRMEIGQMPFVTGAKLMLNFNFGFFIFGREKKMKQS
ncbi:MAG: hypothetical protein ACHQRM_09400 [Bacteroidia bacterium]